MRAMSYFRLRKKTGLYEYRRFIPPELRGHLPPVTGFPDKPGRTKFTLALGTAKVAEANQRAAEIDGQVQQAIDAAKAKLAALTAPAEKAVHSPAAAPPPVILPCARRREQRWSRSAPALPQCCARPLPRPGGQPAPEMQATVWRPTALSSLGRPAAAAPSRGFPRPDGLRR
jgi:hypothetical protein